MKKIVINKCYGGFSLSKQANLEYLKEKGITPYFFKMKTITEPLFEQVTEQSTEKAYLEDTSFFNEISIYTSSEANPESYHSSRDIARDDPALIAIIERLGEKASSSHLALLRIVEIPDDAEWELQDYDGIEWIAEKHRTWS